MSTNNLQEKVIELIRTQFNQSTSTEITLDSDLTKDFNADSLDIVEFIMKLEEEFNVEISDEEALNIKTVRQIISYIEEKQSK